MPRYKLNQGTAIVTALLITMLVAMVVTLLLQQARTATHRTQQMLTLSQIFGYTHGVEAWAAATILKEANHDKEKTFTQASASWLLPPTVIDGITVSGELIDAQSRFNVNNLLYDDKTQSWQNALRTVLINHPSSQQLPGIDMNTAIAISQHLAQWLAVSGGPLDKTYADQYGYTMGHAPMASVSEMRLLAPMTPAIYNAVAADFIALPATSAVRVNVNTASAEVLAGVTGTTMAEMLALINNRPFHQVSDFVTRIQDHFKDNAERDKLVEKLSVDSHYFLVKTRLTIDKKPYLIFTLMQQDANKIIVLARSRGTL